MGAKFGDATNPLLFSVRSGARVSMPGMMDTVLNLGLNDKTVEGLVRSCPGTNGLPMTVTAVLYRCTAMLFSVSSRKARKSTIPLRSSSTRKRRTAG